jgi:flagellar hook-associated protein 3 FlgL
MGTLRVTQQVIVNRVLDSLQKQQRDLLGLQEQLASGQRILTPSDNPIDARRAINTRAAIALNDQYLRNISTSASFLSVTETALMTVNENLQRARELVLQGASGTYNQDQLNSIAEEVNEIVEALLDTGNQQFTGRFVFAGNRTESLPFEATRNVDAEVTAVTYVGNSEEIDVATGRGSTIAINEPGDKAFQDTQDIFQLLIDIRDDLRAGDQTSLGDVRLLELDAGIQQTNQAVARVGATQNRVSRAEFALEDFALALDEQLSDNIDADFAEVIVDLNAQSNAYQAALDAASRVISPSLLDYL